ncbi:hypothetical protein OE699_01990 [Sedimentimonas flavescens]|uniref:Uncharacterized protein n=1 Tax=Sedimentimonas flavescens TaxID=2851012 RepID=A0ABT2ZV30_9RHOB|nr:hypothetical protein [Sedimentimonas flavescens]MCV2877610.1 hypothetical protein [Sedimentimonas flavescens]
MSDNPIKAIFTGEFHYTSMTRNAGWSAYPSPKPQTFPREFIEAAIAKGRAKPVPRKRKAATEAETPSE